MKPKKPKLHELPAFVRAYITAALWTEDPHAPSGDYATSGRPEALYARLTAAAVRRMIQECNVFQFANRETLARFSPSDESNGHDFWLTRNHHGAGFWDRPQRAEAECRELAARLTDAAHASGERSLAFHKGRIYYQ